MAQRKCWMSSNQTFVCEQECTQPDKPPFIFVGLRTAARLLIPVFEADTPPHVQQELLRHLNSSIKSAREFHETGCQHQYLYLSLLCIEELSRALGSSQVGKVKLACGRNVPSSSLYCTALCIVPAKVSACSFGWHRSPQSTKNSWASFWRIF